MSRNWADLVKRARSKQLTPDEFTTGNFTISNLGMFGVESFDAILPPGEWTPGSGSGSGALLCAAALAGSSPG
jgi:pyruvate dehydrogenase E2 component (dihydrolipoamide acetyltransferase)